MAIEDMLDEVKSIDRADAGMIVRHRGEYAFVSLDEAETECETIEGEAYSDSLKKTIKYSTAVSLESGIPEAYITPILAHEIGEEIMKRKGYSQDKAHRYGKRCEREYAEAFMDDETAEEFFGWLREKRAEARRENGLLFDDF